MFDFIHSANSTAEPIWHSNPTVRGTWGIYQSCITTIIICVWQSIHLNVPAPDEPHYWQTLRKGGWAVLAIIAPELVALNAWLQYREAKRMLDIVNGTTSSPWNAWPPKWFTKAMWTQWSAKAIWMCLSPVRLLDYGRMRIFHPAEWRSNKDEELPRWSVAPAHWTMAMAYYATCGGLMTDSTVVERRVLRSSAIESIAESDPMALRELKHDMLLDQSKSGVIRKTITCIQVLWFCTQSISRMKQGLGISLLELNTFAHCVSAFFIYVIWWHKPYDVSTCTSIDSRICLVHALANDLLEDAYTLGAYNPSSRSCICDCLFAILGPVSTDGNSISLSNGFQADVHHGHEGVDFNAILSSLTRPDPQCKLSVCEAGVHVTRHPKRSRGTLSRLQELGRLWSADLRLSFNWGFARRVHNNQAGAIDEFIYEYRRLARIAAMVVLASALYGLLHLLAWNYQFRSRAEGILWRVSCVFTMTLGPPIVLLFYVHATLNDRHWRLSSVGWLEVPSVVEEHTTVSLLALTVLADVFARTYLVLESFIALPNSPASIYSVPVWTAYVPHI